MPLLWLKKKKKLVLTCPDQTAQVGHNFLTEAIPDDIADICRAFVPNIPRTGQGKRERSIKHKSMLNKEDMYGRKSQLSQVKPHLQIATTYSTREDTNGVLPPNFWLLPSFSTIKKREGLGSDQKLTLYIVGFQQLRILLISRVVLML